tara:strand:+ start:91 stop:1152 length:1062 start_codon:yes stop_codon:yes gene_type:complete
MFSKHLLKLYRTSEPYHDRTKYIRLDKNERIKPFSKKIINDFKKISFSEILQTYPISKKLIKEIAKKEKINEKYINIIPGSDGGLKYIFELFAGEKSRAMGSIFPTYGMIEIYAKIYKYNFHKINFNENLNNNIKKLLKKVSFIYIANPNQPSGKYIKKSEILNIIRLAKKKNIFVVVDEAYIDFSGFKSISIFAKKFTNLIVLKTFSKSYGLAGLRIGYLLANEKFNKIFNSIRPSYDVSHFSIKIAEYFLKNEKIKKSYIKQVESSKKYLIKECKKRNLGFIDTKTNFFYIKVPNKQIKKMYKFMFANKVLIRTSFWEDFKKLDNSIRITVGDISMMKIFFKLFDKVYKKR